MKKLTLGTSLTRRMLGRRGALVGAGILPRDQERSTPGAAAVADGPGEALVTFLAGTPHVWVPDERGTLHWAGDRRALAQQSVRWNVRRLATLAELLTYARGDPLLSTAFLKMGEPIYHAKWDVDQDLPVLLHVQSLRDLELLGISSANYHRCVLEQAAWEQRGIRANSLSRGVLAPVATSAGNQPRFATVELERGDRFTLRLSPFTAPLAVANFEEKVRSGFYDGLTFHRVESWVVQGGDPSGRGEGGENNLPLELNSLPFTPGAMGMARRGPLTPNSSLYNNDAQFFIVLTSAPHLDGTFTNMGAVAEGMDVVRGIRFGERIKRITLAPA